jgi:hypothetical protein
MLKKTTYSCLGWSAWWESTKWISWKESVMLVNWKGKSREYPKSTSFTPPRRNFHLDWHNRIPGDKPCNFLDICHPWESTKWISWKEFAQTGWEKVCDKVKINKLEWKLVLSKSYKHRIQYLTKPAYISVTRCCEQK